MEKQINNNQQIPNNSPSQSKITHSILPNLLIIFGIGWFISSILYYGYTTFIVIPQLQEVYDSLGIDVPKNYIPNIVSFLVSFLFTGSEAAYGLFLRAQEKKNKLITHKQKVLAYSFLLLPVLLVILSIPFYFASMLTPIFKLTESFGEPEIVEKLSPTPTLQNETANWKTYTSIDGKYSLQYPKEYTLEETDSIKTADKYPAGKKQVSIKPSAQKLNFIIYINYYPVPSPEVTNEVMQQVSDCDVVNAQKINHAPKGKNFILDNQKAVMYENSLCAQFTSTNFYALNNNKVYSILVTSTEEYNLHKTLVDQILSTFKFLDEN